LRNERLTMDLHHLEMIGRVFYYGIPVAAVLRGDRPLRYAGAAIMANTLLTPLAQIGHVKGQPYYGIAVLDIGLVIALAVFLVRDRRWWLVVATACFLMCTLTHFAAMIGAPLHAYTISTVRILWAYGMILSVGWGLGAHELYRRGASRTDAVRALIAEQGEARTQAELDRRYLSARTPAERAEATRLVETLRQLIDAS
jgi:hypothetical protein